MKSVKLLVISHSCVESVNRAVYRLLVNYYNIHVHLVIPRNIQVGVEAKMCSPIEDEPFTATLLEPIGSHLRLLRLKGLKNLIKAERPSHILVEADPASLLVNDALQAAQNCQAQVWALTNENLRRNYLFEVFQELLRCHLKTSVGRLITWWLWQLSRRRLNHVFTISQDGTRSMMHLGFMGRVTQIPLGFDPQLFYPQSHEKIAATRQRLGLQNTTVAYFGRLSPEKGIDLLLLALAKLKDLPWQFLIDTFSTYQSPYTSLLRNQIKTLGISNRVVFFDALHSEMPDYMNAVDIVVLPSISRFKIKEQYGRVLPEAMACGKIVVGSQSGTISELIGDSGFLFPEGDVDALTNCLRCLLTVPEEQLEPVRTKAKQRAQTYLSILSQADIWANMLKQSN